MDDLDDADSGCKHHPEDGSTPLLWASSRPRRPRRHYLLLILIASLTIAIFLLIGASFASSPKDRSDPCDTVSGGYQCLPQISHFWGQYSAYFSVPSDISADLPPECEITFAQILSRHGARDPTASKTRVYGETIRQIHANVDRASFTGPYAFLADFKYVLGADQLTYFGREQLVHSGTKFYSRYQALARTHDPFVRSSSQNRVVESAFKWAQGFHAARVADETASKDPDYPYPVVLQYEGDGFNNSLSHTLCDEFENGPYSRVGDVAQEAWVQTFVPPIQARLNAALPGANLSTAQTIYMMDLCPFHTVSDDLDGSISPFCALFTEPEWHDYNHFQTLGKHYGFSHGNPLGPTQGVGFVNELIARLTNSAVTDHTSTNRTLDGSPRTFPLGRKLYADFSHDNDMASIFAALGLYNSTSHTGSKDTDHHERFPGYSAAWTVPFAARAYLEKMTCSGAGSGRGGEHDHELVRVIVNDRVQPLEQCGGDSLGRCRLDDFVESLGFARTGGAWDRCFGQESR